MNWPIGSGKGFKGVYDREEKYIHIYSDTQKGTKEGETTLIPVSDEDKMIEYIGNLPSLYMLYFHSRFIFS